MRPLSRQVRCDIKALLDKKLSVREIAVKLGVGKTSVSKIRKELNKNQNLSKGGRKHKLTDAEQKFAVKLIERGSVTNATEATKIVNRASNKQVSRHTVIRVLKRSGFMAVTKKKKPKLLKRHKIARLNFCEKYKNYTVADWKAVFFSDETKINRIGSDGHQYAWKKKGSPLKDHQVIGTVKFGGGNLMVWGCFCYDGLGKIIKIDGKMTAAMYCEILKQGYLRSVRMHGKSLKDVVFQHDNDPKHTAKITKQYIKTRRIRVLDWPSMSPDLNPIENLWSILKRQLNQYDSEPNGMSELWDRVEHEWSKISQETCKKLIESMPRRIYAVIKAKGSYTKY